ncbi:hypothetical protein BTR14_14495 [Rhizobium rhizosphaerae]|uniref:DUF2272 domain-containing protein n=1 Tax=Xaviernesmea rhizosphaerae TaxID=1672749 RepID=A0ABX3PCD2_9HYPH|nr:DUF2272 domain-containing protein [Xaviernesmea rhizosphaerae]OQP85673.1 hypothetical protein BTR14_14495 [Xaviernesmea rhizosphaerae]
MSFIDAVKAIAFKEWEFFGKDEQGSDHFVHGAPKETVEPYASRIGDYWLSIPSDDYDQKVKQYAPKLGKLDGTIRVLPWSAAFISYVMQSAGAGHAFPYSSGHYTWIRKAIENAAAQKHFAPLVGYPLSSYPLQVGDLIGGPRGEYSKLHYEDVLKTGWFKSHSDLIVEIDREKRKAYAIGGNVGQSVARTEVDLDADGKLADGKRPWFVHIRNNITVDLVAALHGQDELVMAG